MRHAASNHGSPRRAGFSLVELMIVLVLITVLVGFAAPRIDFTKYRMDASARSTRSALQNAQRLAITRQFDVVVTFDLGEQSIRIHEDHNNNLVIDAGERVIWRPLEDGARFAAPPVGVHGGSVLSVEGSNLRYIDGNPTVIFRRNGAASTDLEVYLGSAREQHRDMRAITVVQATGRTQALRFDGSSWAKGRL